MAETDGLTQTGAPQVAANRLDKDPFAAGGSYGTLPTMTEGLTFDEIGNTGLRAYAGWVREEFLPQLVGRQAARVYREMSDNSPVIGGILFAIQSTMRKVEWRVEPSEEGSADKQEAADFAHSLMEDMSQTWEEFIIEALSMLPYGYAPMEIVYKRRDGFDPGKDANGNRLPPSKYDDGKIGWRKIPIRGQDTILKWFFGPNGEILGVTQQPWVGTITDIPIEKMLLFRPSQRKGNPEGYSVLRNAYRSYYFVKRIEEQEAILFERLNGMPLIRVPLALMEQAKLNNPDAVALMNTFKKIAVNVRVDEQMGIVMPSDTFQGPNGPSDKYQYDFSLVTPGQGRGSVDADKTIVRHQTNMMVSVLADFLQLGHGQQGTQTLSVSKQDLFFQAVEGYLNTTAAVLNRYGLPRLWKLNGLDPKSMPRFVPDLAQRTDLDVLSNYILRLSQAGMPIFPNPDIESSLKETAGLPDVDSPEALALATGAYNDVPPNPEDGKPEMTATPFGKMILSSIARRAKRLGVPLKR